jgi:hypothetical protein
MQARFHRRLWRRTVAPSRLPEARAPRDRGLGDPASGQGGDLRILTTFNGIVRMMVAGRPDAALYQVNDYMSAA